MSTLPGMDENETRAWLALMSLVQILASSLDSRLRDMGLTTFELSALVVLDESTDRALFISQIAERAHAPLPRMSKVVARLEARGLVRRSASPTDARASCIHLTPEGRRVMIRALPVYSEQSRQLVIDRLGPQQLEQLGDLLQPVVLQLDPLGPLARFLGRAESPASEQVARSAGVGKVAGANQVGPARAIGGSKQ